ncbi:hypothetical protein EJ110_NYTH25824 [Nymphaea thermarum]|nr:hypothetical protein EJ110_NYTH25824 [Nymphaea thermarum]
MASKCFPNTCFIYNSPATTCLLDTNDHAAEEILAYKEDIRSNDQLYDIVKEYFDLSYKTLDFLFDLQRRLNELKGKLAMLRSSFQHPTSRETKVLALEKFRDCEGFNADLISSLTNVITAHTCFLVKLQGWKDKSEKRINILRRRRKMIYVLFVTVFVCAVVCSILAAALHALPLLASLPAAAVTLTSWGPLTSWVENLWKGEESNLQSDVQIAEKVKRSNSVVIHELRGIKLSVKALMDQKAILESNTELVLGTADDNFILNNMKSIMQTSRRLIERMDKLDEQVTTCCSGIENRRSEILERIKNGRHNEFREKLAMLCSSFQHRTSIKMKALVLEEFGDCEGFTGDFLLSLMDLIEAHTSFLRKCQRWNGKSEKS